MAQGNRRLVPFPCRGAQAFSPRGAILWKPATSACAFPHVLVAPAAFPASPPLCAGTRNCGGVSCIGLEQLVLMGLLFPSRSPDEDSPRRVYVDRGIRPRTGGRPAVSIGG